MSDLYNVGVLQRLLVRLKWDMFKIRVEYERVAHKLSKRRRRYGFNKRKG